MDDFIYPRVPILTCSRYWLTNPPGTSADHVERPASVAARRDALIAAVIQARNYSNLSPEMKAEYDAFHAYNWPNVPGPGSTPSPTASSPPG